MLGAVLGPLSALAANSIQGSDNSGTVGGIIAMLSNWIGYIIPLLVTIAIGYFIWGVIQFMIAADEESKKVGRTKIINGLIGLFVIMAFWGIIAVVKNTFGIKGAADTSNSIVPYSAENVNQ